MPLGLLLFLLLAAKLSLALRIDVVAHFVNTTQQGPEQKDKS